MFDSPAEQPAIYQHAVQNTVSAVLNGYNSSILCYGQTGSGKTHTYFGPEGIEHNLQRTYCPSDPTDINTKGNSSNQEWTEHDGTSGTNGAASSQAEDDYPTLPPSSGLVVRACVELLAARTQMARRGINMSVSLQVYIYVRG